MALTEFGPKPTTIKNVTELLKLFFSIRIIRLASRTVLNLAYVPSTSGG